MTEHYGELIRATREAKGWSQEFLAAKVGATQSTIDRIESGHTRKSRVLPEIADALEIDLPGVARSQKEKQTVPSLVRVTYVLPYDLISRLEKYKQSIGVSSDDEAARRLMDDALKSRDDHRQIIERMIDKYKHVKSMREAAGIVIANHPLIKTISFIDDSVSFEMTDGFRVTLDPPGVAILRKKDGTPYMYHEDDCPEWLSSVNRTDDWGQSDEFPF